MELETRDLRDLAIFSKQKHEENHRRRKEPTSHKRQHQPSFEYLQEREKESKELRRESIRSEGRKRTDVAFLLGPTTNSREFRVTVIGLLVRAVHGILMRSS